MVIHCLDRRIEGVTKLLDHPSIYIITCRLGWPSGQSFCLVVGRSLALRHGAVLAAQQAATVVIWLQACLKRRKHNARTHTHTHTCTHTHTHTHIHTHAHRHTHTHTHTHLNTNSPLLRLEVCLRLQRLVGVINQLTESRIYIWRQISSLRLICWLHILFRPHRY